MLIEYNSEDYEVVSKHHVCDYHKRNPGKAWAGCTCGGSYGFRKKDPIMALVDRDMDERAEVFKRLTAQGLLSDTEGPTDG